MDSASEVGDSTVILHRSCAASHRKVSHQGYSRIPEDRSADGLRAHRLAGAILDTRQFLNVKDTIKQYGSLCRCGYMMCENFPNVNHPLSSSIPVCCRMYENAFKSVAEMKQICSSNGS